MTSLDCLHLLVFSAVFELIEVIQSIPIQLVTHSGQVQIGEGRKTDAHQGLFRNIV